MFFLNYKIIISYLMLFTSDVFWGKHMPFLI